MDNTTAIGQGLFTQEQVDYVNGVADADLRAHLLHQVRLRDNMEKDRNACEVALNSFKHSLQVLENQDPWISVKDRLPEDLLEYYLIWGEDEDGDRQVYIAYITTDLKWFYRGSSFQNVTHWKSLPTPPKTTPIKPEE